MEKAATRAERVLQVTDRMLERVEDMLLGLGEKDAGTLKQLTGSLKDLRDIQSRTEAEQRELSRGQEDGPLTGVILIGAVEDG